MELSELMMTISSLFALVLYTCFIVYVMNLLRSSKQKIDMYMISTLILLGVSNLLLALDEIDDMIDDGNDITVVGGVYIAALVQQTIEKIAIIIDIGRLAIILAMIKQKSDLTVKYIKLTLILFILLFASLCALTEYIEYEEKQNGDKDYTASSIVFAIYSLFTNLSIIIAYPVIYYLMYSHYKKLLNKS